MKQKKDNENQNTKKSVLDTISVVLDIVIVVLMIAMPIADIVSKKATVPKQENASACTYCTCTAECENVETFD